jgi:hypothetical protein
LGCSAVHDDDKCRNVKSNCYVHEVLCLDVAINVVRGGTEGICTVLPLPGWIVRSIRIRDPYEYAVKRGKCQTQKFAGIYISDCTFSRW